MYEKRSDLCILFYVEVMIVNDYGEVEVYFVLMRILQER
jgi:hypothetical protein